MDQRSKYLAFKALHEAPEVFVIPNPWNAGTAHMMETLGFEALATTSAGYGFSVGKNDSSHVFSRQEILDNAAEIVAATDLPVSADLESGFGKAPEACALTIELACEIGLVGGTLEDVTGDKSNPIYEFDLAVERVAAACDAAADRPFLLTARSENFLHGRPDLDDTIKRLQAFSKAGADVLYAPGLPDLDAIRTVCDAVDKPVNVVMGLSGPSFSVDELQQAGVKRISVGGSFARAALGGLLRAAIEVKENGTFDYAEDAVTGATAAHYTALKD